MGEDDVVWDMLKNVRRDVEEKNPSVVVRGSSAMLFAKNGDDVGIFLGHGKMSYKDV